MIPTTHAAPRDIEDHLSVQAIIRSYQVGYLPEERSLGRARGTDVFLPLYEVKSNGTIIPGTRTLRG